MDGTACWNRLRLVVCLIKCFVIIFRFYFIHSFNLPVSQFVFPCQFQGFVLVDVVVFGVVVVVSWKTLGHLHILFCFCFVTFNT